MPIEIKELHIKAVINEASDPSAEPGTNKPAATAAASADEGGSDKDDLIAECVEKVLYILQKRNEY